MFDPTKKRITQAQGQRRSPSKTVGGVKSHLESNIISIRDAHRAQTKPCVQQESPESKPDMPLSVECLMWRYGSAVAFHWG